MGEKKVEFAAGRTLRIAKVKKSANQPLFRVPTLSFRAAHFFSEHSMVPMKASEQPGETEIGRAAAAAERNRRSSRDYLHGCNHVCELALYLPVS